MTEQKWLNFAGFLNNCLYGLENKNCPFLKFHKFDQFQKHDYLLNISEKEAGKMIKCCEMHHENCTKPGLKLFLKSLELELVS